MRFTCIERSETRVVIYIDPGWIAKRILGKSPSTIELGRVKKPGSTTGTIRFTSWHARGSNRPLDTLPYAEQIANAIDFRPVEIP
jgi:hypothetical protein